MVNTEHITLFPFTCAHYKQKWLSNDFHEINSETECGTHKKKPHTNKSDSDFEHKNCVFFLWIAKWNWVKCLRVRNQCGGVCRNRVRRMRSVIRICATKANTTSGWIENPSDPDKENMERLCDLKSYRIIWWQAKNDVMNLCAYDCDSLSTAIHLSETPKMSLHRPRHVLM